MSEVPVLSSPEDNLRAERVQLAIDLAVRHRAYTIGGFADDDTSSQTDADPALDLIDSAHRYLTSEIQALRMPSRTPVETAATRTAGLYSLLLCRDLGMDAEVQLYEESQVGDWLVRTVQAEIEHSKLASTDFMEPGRRLQTTSDLFYVTPAMAETLLGQLAATAGEELCTALTRARLGGAALNRIQA